MRKLQRRVRRQRDLGRYSRSSVALRALTSGALALPGLAGSAHAGSPVTKSSGDYNFSFYSEDSIPSSKVAQGSSDRYEIELHQIQVKAPLGENSDLQLDIAHETMSGATPFFVVPDGKKLEQVMTGATVKDQRTDVLATGNLFTDWGKATLNGGFSVEDDYFALNAGLSADLDLNEEHTTLSGGLGTSFDEIDPENPDGNVGPRHDETEYKHSVNTFVGISQIIDRQSAIQTSFTYQNTRGFLSDPYKAVLQLGEVQLQPDSRPGRRNQFAVLTRYRNHFPSLAGTFHADYNFFIDDWNINSHTFNLAWYQDLWWRLKLVPSVRYYSQSEADFYTPYLKQGSDKKDFSSDYRLSGYGAVGLRARAEIEVPWRRYEFGGFVSYERYISDTNIGFQPSDQKAPGLVSFNLISLGFTAKF